MRPKTIMLAAAASAAFLGRRPEDELVGTRGVEKIARDQELAATMRRRGKVIAQAAVRELVKASNRTVVLNHIHPRWLREEVTRRMDAGEQIDAERVEQLRAIGAGR